MKSDSRRWLVFGAVLGGLAVACGAFGDHALKAHFAADGSLSPAEEHQLAVWEIAARYEMYHALALLAVGILAGRSDQRLLHIAGWLFTVGTVIFSGCMYALALTGQRWLGAIVPIGGISLIAGWVCLAISVAPSPVGRGSG